MSPRPKTGAEDIKDRLGTWTDHAACLQHDPDLWFPHDERSARTAITICWECPVIKECDKAAHTIPRHRRHGVWAGVYHSPDKP